MARPAKQPAPPKAVYFKADPDMVRFLEQRARKRRVSLSDAVRELVLAAMAKEVT